MARHQSLLRNPDPIVRQTFWAHLWLFALSAPFNAMVMYAPFLAVKTFKYRHYLHYAWFKPEVIVPAALTAIIPASHLAAIFFTRWIGGPKKVAWVVWPMVVSNAIFVLLPFVDHDSGWLFAFVIIMAMLLRAPIISAQSAVFRLNYPPSLRSYALSVPMAWQMAINGLYAIGAGRAFDLSEQWIIPYFLLAGALGVVGAFSFRNVQTRESLPTDEPGDATVLRRAGGYLNHLGGQVRGLSSNPAFFRYQLAYMFFGSGTVAIAAVLPFYLKVEFGATHQQASSAINAVPMLTIAVTLPIWGWLLDRFNVLLMRAVTTGVWLITPLLLFYAADVQHVFYGQLVQGLVWSGSTLIWWLGVNYFARSHEVANLMSLHQTLTGVRGVFMPFLGMAIGAWLGYRNSMLFWFVLMAIGFAFMVDETIREARAGRLRTFSENEAELDQLPNPVTAASRE